ncbi:MAG TPA: ferritin [Marinilabiliales bacterium]|jgi:ferritin|nr:MAG: ferritin [Bacteroidetes bacterium GWA2_40_14]OFX60202.1 MAG: ferritin [Bacteroidetes bacterium GWC2_40_13]OFX75046.1 MAG: ferritin [Bacteroidetes bacterium GWD2_40_43]OFX89619.1 MAG: ferritin [Bacteroidetes bacterium GWE2_40_63]OFY24138.1 MAG: ferritin [Bacteroidetes bacterium GWF2_40_13]OFZ26329.1 MAG: ferritin [Bacteroidetes bacterium RIFOXYC2_FULL_40_12]HAM99554.1 ferritin [Marinilabiliales bacterium]
MITKRIEDELNKQVNAEYWSAYFYLSMSAYCAEIGLAGAANWFRVQYQEEIAHALKFFDYIIERGGKVDLKPIAEVPKEWNGIIHIFEDTQKHEQIVTSLIYHLMDVAIEERDHAAKSFLQWYVDEQVEEESNVQAILDQLRMVEGKGNGLFMIDKDLALRVFVDPTIPK